MAKTIITNLHDMVSSSATSYIHANKDDFRSTVQGPQGLRGTPGIDGTDGEGVVITSILNNLNKSITINFSDGTQHTTDPLKGEDGRSVTITNVVNNANGTMLINFSDGTSHTTANLAGPRGFKGDNGDHVHHVSYQRSKDSLGNDMGPTTPSTRGYTDTYAMWTSQEELPEMYIGEFTVYNGRDVLSVEEKFRLDSVEIGATADQEAFEVPYDNSISGLLSEDVQNSVDELSATKLNLIEKGQPNGVAELDANGLVPSAQLPSYVDDVIEVTDYTSLPVVGESGKIYIVVEDETSGGDTSSYRWTGTIYAMVSNTLTAEDIKALYESNANTNEYSDAEKLKVGHISVTQAVDLDAIESRQGTAELDTVATNLSEAVNEIHGELDAHIADTEDAHDASAVSHIPGDNTYAIGDELQTVIEQIDTELEDQDNRLDTLEDADTVEGSVLKSIKDTAKDAIYDNTTSALAATTLNAAIDELDNVIDIHKASTGEDHTYINQDVTTTAIPTFAGIVTEGLVDGRDVSVDGTKLDTIEENAKDDQLASEVPAVAGTNTYAIGIDVQTQLNQLDAETLSQESRLHINEAKLSTIEEGATADQTASEIETLYESNTNTNKYTDAEKAKVGHITVTQAVNLDTIEMNTNTNNAKVSNVTTNISTSHSSNSVTVNSSDGADGTINSATQTLAGVMSATDKTKLDGVEAGATGDQTAAEIKTAYESNNNTNALTDSLLTLLSTKKVKDVSTDAINDKLVITYTDNTVSNLNINDIITDIHVNGASLDATSNVLTLTSADGGADITVDLSDFVNSSELTTALANHYTKTDIDGLISTSDSGAVKLEGNQTIAGVKTFSSTIAGNITGTASTATKLATARTIDLSGDVSGSTTFDGSGNVSISATVANDSHTHSFANLTSTPTTATRWPTFAEVTGKPATFAPSTHTHTVSQVTGLENVDNTKDVDKTVGRFAIHDTRNVVSVPNNVPDRSGLFEFKNVASVGNPPMPSSPTYAHVLTTNGWTADGSGGWPTQVSLGDALSFRKGTSATTWGPWRELISTDTTLGATGTSTNYPMSQKATTDALNTKAPSSHTHPWSQVTGQPATATRWPTFAEVTSKPIVQATGTSTIDIMSQKAVTDAITAGDNKVASEIPVTPVGSLSSNQVQLALEEIMDKIYDTKEW